MIDQVLLDESLNYFLCYIGIKISFYLFSEVVDGHQNESVSIACFGIDRPYEIQTSHIKRPI